MKFVAFQRQQALFVSPRNGKIIIVRKILLEFACAFVGILTKSMYAQHGHKSGLQMYRFMSALCKSQPAPTVTPSDIGNGEHATSRSTEKAVVYKIRCGTCVRCPTFEEIFTDLPNPHRGHHRTWRSNMEKAAWEVSVSY